MFGEDLAPGENSNFDSNEVQHMDDQRLKEMMIKFSKGMIWKCPNCSAIVEKKIDPLLNEVFGSIVGTNTCKECGASFSSQDVYNRKFDITFRELKSIAGEKLIDRGINLMIQILENNQIDTNSRIEALIVLEKIGDSHFTYKIERVTKDQNNELQNAAKKTLERISKKKWQFWKK